MSFRLYKIIFKSYNCPEPVFNVFFLHNILIVPTLYRIVRFCLVVVLASKE